MIINPIKINDIGIGKFLAIILSFQAVMLALIGLEVAGFSLPFLRQVFGFIYLAFIPGILLLRIFKLHRLSTVETLGYAVGLSIATVMFTGLIVNAAGPALGNSHPLTTVNLIIALSIVVLILCILTYVRDRDFSQPSSIAMKGLLSPAALFLVLLPLLSILGTYLVNSYQDSTLLLLMIVLVALVPVAVMFGKFIPHQFYPLAIFAIGLALLYHSSLLSMYVSGEGDIHLEFYIFRLTEMGSYWNQGLSHSYNAMLSDTILPVVFSRLMDIQGDWVFKAIYPFFFVLVPLSLYQAYKEQTNERLAFLAVFFFMSIYIFVIIPSLVKQEMAELFLALLILLMVDRRINLTAKSALAIIFSTCLILSHYGTAYLYMLLILPGFFLLYLVKDRRKSGILTGGSVALFFVMALAWYMYISNSITLATVTYYGAVIWSNIGELMKPILLDPSLTKLVGLTGLASWGRYAQRLLYYATLFFIGIGFIKLLVSKGLRMRFTSNYLVMTVMSMGLLFICIVVPYFTSTLGVIRFYHLALFFLAPFCIIGAEAVFRPRLRLFKSVSSQAAVNPGYVKILVLLLLISYYLFGMGFVQEVSGDLPSSASLSFDRIEKCDDEHVLALLQSRYTYAQDVSSARWLSQNKGNNTNLWSDGLSYWKSLPAYGVTIDVIVSHRITIFEELWDNSYVYLSRLNVVNNIIFFFNPEGAAFSPLIYPTSDISHLFEDKVYSNGGSEIYLSR